MKCTHSILSIGCVEKVETPAMIDGKISYLCDYHLERLEDYRSEYRVDSPLPIRLTGPEADVAMALGE